MYVFHLAEIITVIFIHSDFLGRFRQGLPSKLSVSHILMCNLKGSENELKILQSIFLIHCPCKPKIFSAFIPIYPAPASSAPEATGIYPH